MIPRPRPRGNLIGAVVAGGLAIVFSLILLAHDPLLFWNDDYELSILPVCADIARAWSRFEFPLLSPYSWVCGNLAGEYQYGVFSVFINGLIVAVWKFPLIFPQQAAALAIGHLAVLAAGVFLLARGRQVSMAISMLVALVGSLNGWIICWGATDWLGALGAFAWLPWAWWGAERALDMRRSRWRFLWPAPFLYLLLTGGFPYTVLMLALVLGWLATREFFTNRRLSSLLPLVAGVALGLGLGSPAWLALLDYVPGSARVSQNPSAHFQWLVPWNAWPALILPSWTVKWADFSTRMMPHAATELACGLVPIPALIAGFLVNGRGLLKKIRWELGLLIIVSVLAMLPTAGVFRWSFRWLPLFHLVLALCAAEAIAFYKQGSGRNGILRYQSAPLIALLLVVAVLVAGELFQTGGRYLFPLSWMFVALSLLWFVLERLRFPVLREWATPAIAFGAFLATYLCIPPNCGVPKYDFSQTLLRPKPLDRDRLYLSVYPPPEDSYRTKVRNAPVGDTVRPGSTSMWAGLRFVNGYSPIRPAGVAREFATAIHGEVDSNMAEWLLYAEARPDGLLDRLGVDGIVVAREFDFAPRPANDWQLVVTTDEARVFHRRGQAIARVRSVDWEGKHVTAAVSNIADARNGVSASIDVPEGDEPALLAISRPFFPGYRARINGLNLPITAVRNLIPLVEVPAGTHGTLTMIYRPWWFTYGALAASVCALIWAGSVLMAAWQKTRAA